MDYHLEELGPDSLLVVVRRPDVDEVLQEDVSLAYSSTGVLWDE